MRLATAPGLGPPQHVTAVPGSSSTCGGCHVWVQPTLSWLCRAEVGAGSPPPWVGVCRQGGDKQGCARRGVALPGSWFTGGWAVQSVGCWQKFPFISFKKICWKPQEERNTESKGTASPVSSPCVQEQELQGAERPHPCSRGWEAARAASESPARWLQPQRPVGWLPARAATELAESLCVHGVSQFRAGVPRLVGTAGGKPEPLGTGHTQAAGELMALGGRGGTLPGWGHIT